MIFDNILQAKIANLVLQWSKYLFGTKINDLRANFSSERSQQKLDQKEPKSEP